MGGGGGGGGAQAGAVLSPSVACGPLRVTSGQRHRPKPASSPKSAGHRSAFLGGRHLCFRLPRGPPAGAAAWPGVRARRTVRHTGQLQRCLSEFVACECEHGGSLPRARGCRGHLQRSRAPHRLRSRPWIRGARSSGAGTLGRRPGCSRSGRPWYGCLRLGCWRSGHRRSGRLLPGVRGPGVGARASAARASAVRASEPACRWSVCW